MTSSSETFVSGSKFVHAWYEDVLAILAGTLFVSIGGLLFAKIMLLTGGVFGLSLLVAYTTPFSFSEAFFVLNAPLYWLAWRAKGLAFVVRTASAVCLQCLFSDRIATWVDITWVNPVFAAIAGGALIGIGVLFLFRHDTTLGGTGIVAVYLEKRVGWRSGHVLLVADGTVLLLGALVLPAGNVPLSVLGLIVTNGLVIMQHRSDRYVGTTATG